MRSRGLLGLKICFTLSNVTMQAGHDQTVCWLVLSSLHMSSLRLPTDGRQRHRTSCLNSPTSQKGSPQLKHAYTDHYNSRVHTSYRTVAVSKGSSLAPRQRRVRDAQVGLLELHEVGDALGKLGAQPRVPPPCVSRAFQKQPQCSGFGPLGAHLRRRQTGGRSPSSVHRAITIVRPAAV